MTDIYDQHAKAFAQVEAFVILDSNHERVATIAFKFPRDGAGRLYAYVHLLGLEMVRGHASGGGYDKRSAACAAAAKKLPHWESKRGINYGLRSFTEELAKDDGHDWQRNLRDAGFTVLQAV